MSGMLNMCYSTLFCDCWKPGKYAEAVPLHPLLLQSLSMPAGQECRGAAGDMQSAAWTA